MRLLALILFTFSLLAACSTEREWRKYPSQPTKQISDKKQQSEALRDALMMNLNLVLVAAMQEGGPTAAVSECKIKAPAEQAELNLMGHRVGRTSHKLRNPKNVAPAWAQPFVDAKTVKPIMLVNSKGSFHALYPIVLKAQCTICHGTTEQIPEDVRDLLKQEYPQDQATGFAVNDLRGWFWIEID